MKRKRTSTRIGLTADEIHSWPMDACGWHVEPGGSLRRIRIGMNCILGARVKVGDYVTLGAGVTVEDDVVIDRGATLGDGAHVGGRAWIGHYTRVGEAVDLAEDVTLGENVTLGARAELGRRVIIGRQVTLGEHVLLPDGMTSERLNEELCWACREAQYSYIFWLWATRTTRKAPELSGLRSGAVYRKGKILNRPRAVMSDQLWAPGLIVSRIGMRPEYLGIARCYWWRLANSAHELIAEELIALRAEVASGDILHAGFPGAPPLVRVRRLKVLD